MFSTPALVGHNQSLQKNKNKCQSKLHKVRAGKIWWTLVQCQCMYGLWWELYFFPGVAVFKHCSVVTVPASSSQRTHSHSQNFSQLTLDSTFLPVVTLTCHRHDIGNLNQNFEIWYKTSIPRHFWKLIPTKTWPGRPLLSTIWVTLRQLCTQAADIFLCNVARPGILWLFFKGNDFFLWPFFRLGFIPGCPW